MSPSVSVRLLLTQSDERLVDYARSGHERAFEALVERYRRQLHRYCRRLLLSEERAEDALQQALLQAWVALRGGAEVQDVRPWLYRIVHNAAVNALRVSGYDYCTLSESLSGADAPQADLDRRIAVREALAGLAALPEMQREALLRTAVEGRSHQQVASDLGVSEPALRGLVYRARTAMRAAAGAFVPPPLLSWALDAGTRSAPVLERVAGLGVGSGSAGVIGLVVKGSAVAVTAGALAGGIVATHSHKHRAHHPEPARSSARRGSERSAASPPGPKTSLRPVAFTQPDGGKHDARTTVGKRSTHRNPHFNSRPASPTIQPAPQAPRAWSHHYHSYGGDKHEEAGRPASTPHDGNSGDSRGPGSRDSRDGSASTSSHDRHDGGSGPSSEGSGAGKPHDDGGGAQTESSEGSSSKDGSGDTSGQSGGGGETSWSKDGGGDSSGGSGDSRQSESTSSQSSTTTNPTSDSVGSKDQAGGWKG